MYTTPNPSLVRRGGRGEVTSLLTKERRKRGGHSPPYQGEEEEGRSLPSLPRRGWGWFKV